MLPEGSSSARRGEAEGGRIACGNLSPGALYHLRCASPFRMPRAMPSVLHCGAGGSRMTKGRSLPLMEALSIPGHREPLHCFWCYTSAHTCRPIAWLLPVKAGLCLRFRRNTQRVLRLTLPSAGTAPLEQDGFVVELLPKLAFFTLWDRPPSSGLVRSPERDDSAGGLPSGGPPLAGPEESPEPMGGGAGPAVLSPDDDAPAEAFFADDARSPIDLVSDTSESSGSASDSDHSSDVAIVEPVDQAAAVVPCAADPPLPACWPACRTWSISFA